MSQKATLAHKRLRHVDITFRHNLFLAVLLSFTLWKTFCLFVELLPFQCYEVFAPLSVFDMIYLPFSGF